MRDLVIPPAWKDVWITPYDNGHLQAVGTDDAGRRQYLYHPRLAQPSRRREVRPGAQFGKALSRARERILTDLGTEGMELARACAVAVRLLDLGYFRIGNDVYADKNGSFGLTTLERRHVRRQGDALVFCFVGKSGVEHCIKIDDPATVEALETMRRRRGGERPAAGLEGRPRLAVAGRRRRSTTTSARRTGLEATAKDFRTWHATVIAAAAPGRDRRAGGDQGLPQARGLAAR